ncbi:hypothetical protein SI65_04150 [Aspergillus cristatus]|uniref:Uncharacterized protein n=1 Tax=Aspergillus cristatus TaxID=573508 RepID=A0A1E3BJL8_ASPCR|nr:hypothetical protein SI65_04150 [Aspergillus cristatus]
MFAHLEEYPASRCETPPVSPQTSHVLEKLRRYYLDNNFHNFQETLNSNLSFPGFDICSLSCVMSEVIKLKKACFMEELFHHGLPMSPSFAREAVDADAKEVLQSFLYYGWDINQPMAPESPPILSNALQSLEMTTWLLDHGADPNRRCEIDVTPLSYAVERASFSIIKLLLDRGGDVTTGQLLHHAVMRESDSLEAVELLISQGADVNAVMYQNHQPSLERRFFMAETPLHTAIYYGKRDVIRYLISSGADVSIKNAKRETALQFALRTNKSIWTEIIQAIQAYRILRFHASL